MSKLDKAEEIAQQIESGALVPVYTAEPEVEFRAAQGEVGGWVLKRLMKVKASDVERARELLGLPKKLICIYLGVTLGIYNAWVANDLQLPPWVGLAISRLFAQAGIEPPAPFLPADIAERRVRVTLRRLMQFGKRRQQLRERTLELRAKLEGPQESPS